MAKKIRTIDAFMEGRCFAKVKTTAGIKNLMNQLLTEDPEATDKIAEEYRKDFTAHRNSSAYYLTYYKKQHALKVMCSEFFEKIYNSGARSPYIFEV